jgi:hypothetical protein
MLLSALIILGVALLLTAWFAGVMKYRGKKLLYGILVIIFTAFCIWGIINWEEFTAILENRFGVWGMSGIVLVIALVVWLCMHFLF